MVPPCLGTSPIVCMVGECVDQWTPTAACLTGGDQKGETRGPGTECWDYLLSQHDSLGSAAASGGTVLSG